LLLYILCTVPIFKCSLFGPFIGIHNGAPTFNIPDKTFTPITIGFLSRKTV